MNIKNLVASLWVLAVCAACESGTTGAACPPDDPPTYANFGQGFMGSYCTRCHSAGLAGADRYSAPDDINLDSLVGIRQHTQRIEASTASGPSATYDFMPPRLSTIAGQPTLQERQRLGQWLACGLK